MTTPYHLPIKRGALKSASRIFLFLRCTTFEVSHRYHGGLWWLGFDMICSLMVVDGFQRWSVIGGFGGANGFSACGFCHFAGDWVGGARRCELEGGFGRWWVLP